MKRRDILLAALLLGLLAAFALGTERRPSPDICTAATGLTLSTGHDAERRVETPPSLFTMPPTICVPGAETVQCGWRMSGNGLRNGSAPHHASGAMRPSTHNINLIEILKQTLSPHANRDYHVYRLRRIII